VPSQFLLSRRDGPVEHLTLNRPEVRNALNDEMIGELTAWAETVPRDKTLRAVVLGGSGPSFCAGADVSSFSRTASYTADENRDDAARLARLFVALDTLPVPLVGRVHGAAIGGGAGLAAVCDMVVADELAVFAFPEVKLGLMPAVISPFVLAKIGRSAARELFLTGVRFSAARAREIGLVHAVVPGQEIDGTVDGILNEILAASPDAIAAAKALIAGVWNTSIDEAMPATAEAIARRRVSPEGREGLEAFLQKRRPSWHPNR
jgi:methylglutaconyl-CoA hydratase